MLVELDEEPDAPAPHDPAGPGRRWWWVALLVVVGLAMVAAQLVADLRERARVAALARVPGVLAPMPAPPRTAWHLHDDTADLTVVGADLVEERIAADGAMVLTSRDRETGDERWTVPLLDAPAPALPATAARYGLQCHQGAGVPDRLMCLTHDATAVRRADGQAADYSTATSAPATSAQLVVVGAPDGRVVARYPAGSAGTVAAAAAVVGDGVVLAAPLDDGTTAWELDPVTGAERWRVHADTGFGGGWLRWGAEVRVVPVGDGTVAVLGAGVALLDADDGATVASAGTLATVLGAQADGSALVVGSEGYTRLVAPAGDVRLDGAPVDVSIDDGSAPGLTLTTSGGLQAWDASTGDLRWRSTTIVSVWEALVVAGRVHVHDGYQVTTFDARTGEVLWHVSAPDLFPEGTAVTRLATDGAQLLVAGADTAASQAALVALDPADGVPHWEAELPGMTSVVSFEGVLLGRTPEDIVVLR